MHIRVLPFDGQHVPHAHLESGETVVDWLILCQPQADTSALEWAALDQLTGGRIAAVLSSGDFKGKQAETLVLHQVPGIDAERVVLTGLGAPGAITLQSLQRALNSAARVVCQRQATTVGLLLPGEETTGLNVSVTSECAAIAFLEASHGQDLYKKERARSVPQSVSLLTNEAALDIAAAGCRRGMVLGEAINMARDLVNRHPQEIYPESLAEIATRTAADLGLQCEVFRTEQLRQQRMNAMLAVAQGSLHEPRMIVLRHNGADSAEPVTALVGKGVTFDSGGLSLKTAEGMLAMKCDMAGAATVLAVMAAAARLRLPVNLAGYLGLVENMVSGNSYRPGDVLTARNGITIEVQNTDAEGRLVLADVLNYAVDTGAARLVDLATLTGACVVALGDDVTGMFSNDDEWQQQILQAAKASGEDAWPMPMFDHYARQLESDVADCRNIGGRAGGAITAAKFLEKFVDGKPWVHLDIAGPSFASSSKSWRDGGATGCMVRTLVNALTPSAQK
ncbi:MAG: leucyl aminopeptidase [Planctomycetaceae bacterium]|nr:leucyl aminopeptidase [Planctomycetaceae bacterium]